MCVLRVGCVRLYTVVGLHPIRPLPLLLLVAAVPLLWPLAFVTLELPLAGGCSSISPRISSTSVEYSLLAALSTTAGGFGCGSARGCTNKDLQRASGGKCF